MASSQPKKTSKKKVTAKKSAATKKKATAKKAVATKKKATSKKSAVTKKKTASKKSAATKKKAAAKKTGTRRKGFQGKWADALSGPFIHTKIHGCEVVILGTAHISQASVDDVENFIRDQKPDIVCVELCQSRYTALFDEDRWRNLDLVQVIKQRRVYLLMSSLILGSFQRKMGEMTNVKPGQELVTAINEAEAHKRPFYLVDRDIQITLRRAWQSLSYFNKIFLISELMTSLVVPADADPEQIEQMKQKDALEDIFESLPTRYDRIKKILIDERDQYLSQSIKEAIYEAKSPKTAFAVVGAGHLPGIERYLEKSIDLEHLKTVKKKSKFVAFLKFIAPIAIIIGLFMIISGPEDKEKIVENLKLWVAFKAVAAGLPALLLGAHPLGIIGAIATSPISNFNPILKPGWVAGLVEAKFRKPHVSDFESIAEDTTTLRGFFKNKVIRALLIFIGPQLGSSIGTGLFFWYIS